MSKELESNTTNENIWACLLYISSLIWAFPLSYVILPIILWLLTKHKHEFINFHGKNLFNLLATWTIITIALWTFLLILPMKAFFILSFSLTFFIPLLLILGIYAYILIGAYKAYKGKAEKLAFTYEFFK